jgi:hypothetical protein
VKKREFFGRSFYTIKENLWKPECRNEGTYLHASRSERIFFHIYDSDVDNVILIVEAILKWEKTKPQKFSIGFFMIDLVNLDNKAFLAHESPRVLMEEIGENLLRFKTLEGKLRDKAKNAMVNMSEAELIYTIDTVPSMMNIGKIIGPNTIYWLREVMPFVNIKPTKNDIKEFKLQDEEKKEEVKGNNIEEKKGEIKEDEDDEFENKDKIAEKEFEWKWEKIINGLREKDFFPKQNIIFSNIEILVHQNLQKRIEEFELIEYLFNWRKMNSKGQFIDDFKDSENVKKAKFGIDIVDTRLSIRLNNSWRDTAEYSIALEKQYIQTSDNIITKYSSNGSIVVNEFRPHRLEAIVFCLEYIIKVPTYSEDDRLNEFEEKVVEVATLPYLPIIEKEEFEDDYYGKKTEYRFSLINIDQRMEVNDKMVGIRDPKGEPLRIDLMTTLGQKEEGDSMIEDDDLYAIELQRIKEAPVKKLIEQNKNLEKKISELSDKKREEFKQVEELQMTIHEVEDELKASTEALNAQKKKEPSPLKKKYEKHHQFLKDRVEELERKKDKIAEDTLYELSRLFPGPGRESKRVSFEDDFDREVIGEVFKGKRYRNRHRPATDAKWHVNGDEKFLKELGVPQEMIRNTNLNTEKANLKFNKEFYQNCINLIGIRFFAIEFYERLFDLGGTMIPPIINIEYSFQKFKHWVTNPLHLGSKFKKVQYKPNKIYSLEHQDIEVKGEVNVQPLEWFCNDMFELHDAEIISLIKNYKDEYLCLDIYRHGKVHGFEGKWAFAKFKVPMKYLVREENKAQGNFVVEMVDPKETCVIGRIFINIGTYGYPIAQKTKLHRHYKKSILSEKPTRQRKVRI